MGPSNMDLGITDETRREWEEFIEKHPPYDDDEPMLQVFDHPDIDNNRSMATVMKKLLTGEIPAHGSEYKPHE